MAYNNILFLALSLMIYVTYAPKGGGDFSLLLLSLSAVTLGFHLLTWFTYHSMRKKIEEESFSGVRANLVIGVLEKRFALLALLLYFGLVYACGLKNVFWRLPIFEQYSFLDLAAGFSPFCLLLVIVWSNSYKLFQATTESDVKRARYVLSHIRLNAPILLPVFFFSLIRDVIDAVFGTRLSSSEAWSLGEVLWFLPLFLTMIVLYPVVMKFFWGCYPLPEGPRRKKIEGYCTNAGLKVSEILIWPATHERSLTAGITGIIGKLRYFFITSGLLNLLNDEEIESVIAHEAGHVRKGHMYYYVLLFLGFPLFMELIGDLAYLTYYGFSDVFLPDILARISDVNILSLASLSFFTIFIVVYLRIFFGMLSRNFERQADLFVFEVVGHPLNLISSLEKISESGGRIKHIPNWHHFSVGERITFLMACLRDSQAGVVHEQKVRRIKRTFASVFLVALFMVGVLNYTPVRRGIELGLATRQAQRLIAANPHDTGVKLFLADIYFEKKRYDQAESIYQQVLNADPANLAALNNLAWLYATAEDVRFRDKNKALTLAIKAAALKQEPYVLDTLAEAYYVNGKKQEALQAIEAAIALKPANLEYYVAQKQKFLAGKRYHP